MNSRESLRPLNSWLFTLGSIDEVKYSTSCNVGEVMGDGQGLIWMALLAYTLGIKHGLDADHLATIDNFVRGNAQRRPRVARFSGMLFSLGHGAVVITVATAAALMSGTWKLPAWLEDAGALISIAFLLLLGAYNLHGVVHAQAGSVFRPMGFKSRLLPGIDISNPLLIIGVGILFALSFDTLSQALLFSIAVSGGNQPWTPLLLGTLFMLGMMTTDALNGVWTAWLVRRADQTAAVASKVMGLTISGLSLGVAVFGLSKYFNPAWAEETELFSLWMGAGVLLLTLVGYLLAMRLGRRASAI